MEGEHGVRWDELCQTTGRLSARSLREALPRAGARGADLGGRRPPGSLQAFAVREALSAAQRGHDTVVVDLPRSRDPVLDEVVSRCDRVLVVVLPTVARAWPRRCACVGLSRPGRLRVVVRGPASTSATSPG